MRKFKDVLRVNNPELFQKSTIKHNLVLDPDYEKDLATSITSGVRCEISEMEQRGQVMYVGKVPDMGLGYFIGVRLDEPHGKNNGSFNGVQYFQCPNKYGMFIRASDISVGDFPELDIDEI